MNIRAGPSGGRAIARRVALALALLSLAWAILLIWTGGFDTTIAGIPVTAHEPRRPLRIVALAGAVWAALGGYVTLSRIWTAVCARVSARALAAVFTLAVVATGLRFSATVGGGSDSYGYVSQTDLWLKGQLRTPQAFAKEAPWPTPRWTFAPLAYVPGDDDYDLVPRYSAGLPLLMALGKLIAGQPGIFFVVPLSSGVLVLATFLIGRRMGLERTGVIAAFLVASSPVVLYMTSAVMSDVPVAAAWAVAMWCLFGTSRMAAIGCGIASSVAILIRPNLVPQAGVCIAWYVWQAWRASGSDRRARLGQLAFFVLALVPGIAGVAMINASFYGSPAKSGYGPLRYLYGWSNIWPNLRVYTAWLIQSQTIVVFAGLAAILLPIGWLWRGARDRAMAVALSMFVLGMLAQYCLYGVFDAWWYLRFLLPCWPMMMIGLARLVDVLGGRWTPAARFVAVGLVLAIGIRWVTFANANFAFDMRRGEWKYPAVSRAVQQRSDRNSLIFSMLYSGTVRYYGGRMSLSYPALDREWLDRAIAWCREHDIHPYALLEDWEIKEFRETFATQTAGALAGPPLFVYHGPSTVYFFDLAPSETPPATEHMTETYRDISYALPAPPPKLEIR